jgi:hypothetical protein
MDFTLGSDKIRENPQE